MSNEYLNKIIDDINEATDESVPQWAKVLIECFKGLVNQIKETNKIVQRVDELESLNAVHKTVTDKLEAENVRLNDEIIKLNVWADDQEQRGRNMCLLLHGVQENVNENTDDVVLDIVNKELSVSLSLEDIQRSHRLGPKKIQRNTRSAKGSARPIIFRLANYRKRRDVFKAKSRLKGNPISLSENLTKYRYELYKSAITKLGRGNVWTNEGRIISKLNNEYITIKNSAELLAI